MSRTRAEAPILTVTLRIPYHTHPSKASDVVFPIELCMFPFIYTSQLDHLNIKLSTQYIGSVTVASE